MMVFIISKCDVVEPNVSGVDKSLVLIAREQDLKLRNNVLPYCRRIRRLTVRL